MNFVGGVWGGGKIDHVKYIFSEIWILLDFSVNYFRILCDFFWISITIAAEEWGGILILKFSSTLRLCIGENRMLHIQCAFYELRLPLVFHWRITFEIFEPLWNLEYTTGASSIKWRQRKMRQFERNPGVVKRQLNGGRRSKVGDLLVHQQKQNSSAKISEPIFWSPKDGGSGSAGPFSHATTLLTCPHTD